MKTYSEFRQRINDFRVHLTAETNVEGNKKVEDHLWDIIFTLSDIEAILYEIKRIKEEEKT